MNDKVNYYDLILSIKVDVASIKTKVDTMKNAPKDALEAKQTSQEALRTVKEYINAQERAFKIRMAKWSIAVGFLGAIVGGVVSILPNII